MPFFVRFDPDTARLTCSVKGILSPMEVEAWKDALYCSTADMPPAVTFQFVNDLYNYDVADQSLAVHKQMREVVPRFLAAHGFVVGFWRLYEAHPPAPSRSATCTRVAHVHRDCRKMVHFNELLGSSVEQFFCEPDGAEAWLAAAVMKVSAVGPRPRR